MFLTPNCNQITYVDKETTEENFLSNLCETRNKITLIKNLLLFVQDFHDKGFVLGPCENFNLNSLFIDFSTSRFYIRDKRVFLTNAEDGIKRIIPFFSFYQRDISNTPPECLEDYVYYSYKSDVWILGCIIFTLICNGNNRLFLDNEKYCLNENIKETMLLIKTLKDEHSNYKKVGCLKLMYCMIEIFGKYNNNNNDDNVFYFSLLKDMLKYKQSERLTCIELLKKYFKNDTCIKNKVMIENKSDCELLEIRQKSELKEKNINDIYDYFCRQFSIIFNLDEVVNSNLKYIKMNDERLKEYVKYSLIHFLETFKSNKNFHQSILENSNLFFVKLLIVIKSTILHYIIKIGKIHPNDFNYFIKEYLEFNTYLNRNLVQNDSIVDICKNIFYKLDNNI